jgi:putative PIN family toxin of toxin-antitoxin system
MVKVLLDTNVLINTNRGEFSYPKRILDLVRKTKITAVISHAVRRENELIISRLINDHKLQQDLQDYLLLAEKVKSTPVKVTLADDEDIKLLEAAVGGVVNFLITEDKHLLDLEKFQDIQILTPAEFWQWWQKQQDEVGETWNSWAKNILGK